MDNLQLRISLPGTDPLVWREVVVNPNTDLEDMHDIVQAVMDWDDAHMHVFRASKNRMFDPEEDTYYAVALQELLPRKGSKLWYIYDFGDNWEHRIEVVAKVPEEDRETPYLVGGANAAPPEDSGGIPGYLYKLDILANPTHPEYEETLGWLTGFNEEPFNPTSFDLEDTALYLRECMEGFLDELLDEYEEDAFGEAMNFLDIDFGRERKIDYEWVEQKLGLRLTENNIRGKIPEISDFIKRAEQVDDPTPFLAQAEKLHKKYPDNLEIGLALAAMYSFLEKDLKARRLLASLPPPTPERVLYHLSQIILLEEQDQFVAKVSEMPQPLSLANMPAGEGGQYHIEEFLLFEEMAIRFALAKQQLEEAVTRLDQLVRAGYLHADLRPAAMMIAGAQITVVQELIAKHKANPDLPVPPPAKPVSERTQEIIDHSMQEVLKLYRQGGLGGADDWSGESDDDYPGLSLAHSTRKPQQPYIAEKKVGRNEPCPCGSGKKYKKCCG